MSAIALEPLAPAALAPSAGRPARRAWAILVPGALLAATTLVLLALTQRPDVAGADVPDALRVLVRASAGACLVVTGALLFAHLPRHPVGWAMCTAGLGSLVASAAGEYAIYAHVVAPLPGEEWAGWLYSWAAAPILLIPAVALLLFPDGRLPSARWRPALWCGLTAAGLVAIGGMLAPSEDLTWLGHPFLTQSTARAISDPFGIGWFLVLPASIAGIRAIAARRRVATGDTRAQLALLERAGVAVAVAFAACLVSSMLAPAAADVGAVAAVTSLSVLAAAMAVAILRHRLLGLDVFVNRALVLSGMTIVLGALYVGAVLLVSALLGVRVELSAALPATALVAIALGPLRERLQRAVNRLLHGRRDEPYAAMSQLGHRLGDALEPALVLPAMTDTIADVLRLPFVAVELADGTTVEHGTPAAGVALRIGLVHAGERVGTLAVGAREHGVPLGAADRRLLEDFARSAGAAAGAVALAGEVQHSRERLVTAREEERRRLRGDLHDGLGPTLAGAVLTIDAARRLMATDPAAANALLDGAAASVEGAVADVRRVVYGLRPPALDQLGLAGALEQQASSLEASVRGLTCDISAPERMAPLPAAVEVAAFRIAQEALTNVARHAGARRAWVSITVGAALALEIGDDGQGLDPDAAAGVGLTSMRERATELGGSFAVDTTQGAGTVVRVRLPLPS